MQMRKIAVLLLGGALVTGSGTSVLAAEVDGQMIETMQEQTMVEAIEEVPEEVAIEEETIEPNGELIQNIVENSNLIILSGDTVTLGQDVTVASVSMSGGTLDLNGYTMNVTGDVTQEGGHIYLNRGTMNVSGNYTQEEGYSSSLRMSYSNDRLNVGGNYETHSTNNHYANSSGGVIYYLSNGIITIGGDLIVGEGSNYNFYSTSNHKVVFSGNQSHLIDMLKDGDGRRKIADLTVESGKITVNDYLAVTTLESDLEILPVNGELCIDNFGMNGHTVKVLGDVLHTEDTIDVNGGTLDITGHFTQQDGMVNLNRGTMNVGGNYIQEEAYNGSLKMVYSNDRLNVGGSYETYSTHSHKANSSGGVIYYLSDGIMTITGDLIAGEGSDYNFYSTADHKVVLSGENSHFIDMLKGDTPKRKIANLTVESGEITVGDYLEITTLGSDLEITALNGEVQIDDLDMNGHTVKVQGDVLHANDTIDLNEGILDISGDFTQQGGIVDINKGTMNVGGNYIQKEGYSSLLKMVNSNDRLNVGGNYETYSTHSHKANSSGGVIYYLSNGVITVKGDFIEGAGNATHFAATGSHLVKLNGEGIQRVSFANYPSSHFNRLHVTKPIASGYTFNPYPCWNKVSGYIYTYTGFDDVPSSGWKYDNVKYVYEQGVMNGISGTNSFNPDGKLTRAMFATVLYRMAGEPNVSFSNKFTDVVSGKYYSDAVIWAYQQGIVSGFGDGSYGVDNSITREQIAKMLCEFGRTQGYDMSTAASLNEFTDASVVNGWATGYMQWAVGAKLITGKPNGDGSFRLDPQGEATRAECSKMLSMFMQNYME